MSKKRATKTWVDGVLAILRDDPWFDEAVERMDAHTLRSLDLLPGEWARLKERIHLGNEETLRQALKDKP